MTAEPAIVPLTMLGAAAAACEGPDCLVPEQPVLESSTGVPAAD